MTNSSSSGNKELSSRTKHFTSIYITLVLILCFQLYQYRASQKDLLAAVDKGVPALAADIHQRSTDSISDASKTPATTDYTTINKDEAEHIIRTAYQKSYAHILPCDNSTVEANCMAKTRDYFNPTTEEERQALPSIPWWFQTLLRDVNVNGAFGFWHHFSTTDPALNYCTIEKVATTEWRRVFCDLNEDDCQSADGVNYPHGCTAVLPGRRCAVQTKKHVPSDAPHAVFLRDPLERVLSGFLDKCARYWQRTRERQCEPNEVFNTGEEGWGDQKVSPTLDFEKNPKQYFAAYLDIMPLKWNLHFIPQALYCDLYRNINEFAFVGNMGNEFMTDLDKMAKKFGGKLPSQLDKTFGYVKAIETNQLNNTGSDNYHSTRAPEKVAMYYNAASVRKALELYSIDYVTLGLEVPEWAKQMLRDDTA